MLEGDRDDLLAATGLRHRLFNLAADVAKFERCRLRGMPRIEPRVRRDVRLEFTHGSRLYRCVTLRTPPCRQRVIVGVLVHLLVLIRRTNVRLEGTPINRVDHFLLLLRFQPRDQDRVPGSELLVEQQLLRRRHQVEQLHAVVDVFLRPTQAPSQTLELVAVGQQARKAVRLFERVDVFALVVLDHHDLKHLRVGQISHDDRHLLEAGEASRAPSTLAGDHLEAPARRRTDDERLDDADASAEALRELDELLLVEVLPRVQRRQLDAIVIEQLERRGLAGRRLETL